MSSLLFWPVVLRIANTQLNQTLSLLAATFVVCLANNLEPDQCRQNDQDPNNFTGGKPRNYHEIVLTQICSQATSGTRRGSFQAGNWIKKGWCHVHFCFILQLRTNNGEIRQCSSV